MTKQPSKLSFPKEKINVLILENIHTDAEKLFASEHYNITVIDRALDEDELIEQIKDVSILCIRSATKVTEKAFKAANRLISIGAYCIGTNQIDLQAASEKGVVVFNAPFSNTRSVVELVMADILALNRQLFTKSVLTHLGVWDKSAKGSHEIRNKTLGIVGYGNIGSQLSVVAEAFGMKVVFYDFADKLALGNAVCKNTIDELLAEADVVTVHIDGRSENTGYFDKNKFDKMKQGAMFINLSRGHVVVEQDLADALKSGHLSGAALDVYQTEPKSKDEKHTSPLQNLQNVILTPHIGGSTEEAQAGIAGFVTNKIISFINKGDSSMSVNIPSSILPQMKDSHRLIWVHKNEPGALVGINSIFSNAGININSQYLGTKDTVGYVISDISTNYTSKMIKEINNLPQSIKLRVLY